MHTMLKSLGWAIVGAVVIAPLIYFLYFVKNDQFDTMTEGQAAQQMPPTAVNMAVVQSEDWHPRIEAVGSVVAVQGTMVSTEEEGVVREINFESGTDVKKGDVLLQLDVSVEIAQLREADATADLARMSFDRAKQLLESKSIAQSEFDTAAINLKQAQAKIDNIKALIGKKTCRAPFDGKLGIRQVSVGQYLPIGSEVVSLQSLDPVYVQFSLPQQRLGAVKQGLTVEVTTDAYPGETFTGKITAINPDVDRVTRNVRVQATLDNPDGKLRSGMFASVDVIQEHAETVMFIPLTAVKHAPFGDSVFLIEETTATASADSQSTAPPLAVQQQFVRLGARKGDFVVVTEGLKPGDQLVSTGVFKIRPGMSVVIDNSLAPEFKLEPTPENT